MGRVATPSNVELIDATAELESGIASASNDSGITAIADKLTMNSFDTMKAIGRIETAQFYATVAEKLIAETAINLKEGKKYKGLPYIDENGKARHVAHFDEFCQQFLGKSARRVQELMSNYQLLGPELYEQAEQIGFKQRDYNAIKALPADDKKIIEQAIESKSLDNALDLLQQMAAKHHREKEVKEKTIADLTLDVESKVRTLEGKDKKINELDDRINKMVLANAKLAHIDWPVAFKGYYEQAALIRRGLKQNLTALDVLRADASKITAGSDEEEASLDTAKQVLAEEMVGIYNECIDLLTTIGNTFDKSLGGHTSARVKLFGL